MISEFYQYKNNSEYYFGIKKIDYFEQKEYLEKYKLQNNSEPDQKINLKDNTRTPGICNSKKCRKLFNSGIIIPSYNPVSKYYCLDCLSYFICHFREKGQGIQIIIEFENTKGININYFPIIKLEKGNIYFNNLNEPIQGYWVRIKNSEIGEIDPKNLLCYKLVITSKVLDSGEFITGRYIGYLSGRNICKNILNGSIHKSDSIPFISLSPENITRWSEDEKNGIRISEYCEYCHYKLFDGKAKNNIPDTEQINKKTNPDYKLKKNRIIQIDKEIKLLYEKIESLKIEKKILTQQICLNSDKVYLD